jgi:hypothetical protein
MSIISKQWAESQNETRWDFDILEEANNLQPEHYLPIICEGYGFIAIAKDEYGGIHLGFEDKEGTDNVNWVDYNEIVK